MGKKISWHNEKRKVSDIIPSEYNPRNATEKQRQELNNSLERFNLADPLIINTNGHLIGGHFRLKILREQDQQQEVDVRVPSRKLNDEEERELNLRLNKNQGEWDLDALSNFDEDLLKAVGFDPDELDRIFQLDDQEKERADAVGAVPASSNIKPGEIFKLGDHRLICGDATNGADMADLMGDKKAAMVFTDPPYNVNYTGGMGTHAKNDREGILNDKMEKPAFREFLLAACSTMLEHCTGGIYICMSSSELDTLKSVFEEAGGHWQSFVIWVKNNFTLSRSDYQHLYEPILYGWPAQIKNHYFIERRDLANVWEDLSQVKATFDGTETVIKFHGFEVRLKGEVTGTVSRKKWRADIWRHDKPSRNEEHPTMKPVTLVSEALVNSSKREEIVLDPFGGSGSTMIACELLNRNCYMMELDPRYVQVIINRWEKYTGKKAEKLQEVVA